MKKVLREEMVDFSRTYRYWVSYNSEVVDCKVKNFNMTSTFKSNQELEVVGEYDLSVCYQNHFYYTSQMNKSYHQATSSGRKFFLSENKSLLETITLEEPIKDLDDVEVQITFIAAPKASTHMKSKGMLDAFIEVHVSGEILVQLISKTIEEKSKVEPKEKLVIQPKKELTVEDKKEIEPEKKLLIESKKELELESEEKIPEEILQQEVDHESKEDPSNNLEPIHVTLYSKDKDVFMSTNEIPSNKSRVKTEKKKQEKVNHSKAIHIEPVESMMIEIDEPMDVEDLLDMEVDEIQSMQDEVKKNETHDEEHHEENDKQDEEIEENHIDE